MERKDFEQMIKLLSKTLELRDRIKEEVDSRAEESEDEDEDEDDDDDDDKLCQELSDEYHSIMVWCFGKKFDQMTREKSIAKWKEKHPDLPMPRSLSTNNLNPMFHTVAVLLDAIPLYHAHKKED